ncbi:hypothetical protein BVZ80_01345B, partial [Haemophilus influenzae]
WNAYV